MSCTGCIYTIKSQTVTGKDGTKIPVGDVTCTMTYACNTSGDKPVLTEVRKARSKKENKHEA